MENNENLEEKVIEEQSITESKTDVEDGNNNPEPSQEEQTTVEEPKAEVEEEKPIFTQTQVNDTVSKRLNRLYKRYGVENGKGLDDLIERTKDYDEIKNQNLQLNREIAFLENNINPQRYDDIDTYFKGKGIDFTREALKQELETHPEWRNVATQEKPITTIEKIIPDRGVKETVDEGKLASSLFGFKDGFVR